MRLGIVGSYVLKRACDFLDRKIVKVPLYAPKMSLASVSERGLSLQVDQIIPADFDSFSRTVVLRDFNKSIYSEIEAATPDVVLIDFLDDYVGFYHNLGTDSVITRSSYLGRCNLEYFKNSEWSTVDRMSDLGWSLWLNGCERFLERISKESQIILVKTFHPEMYIENGETKFYPNQLLERVRQHNAVIKRCCEVFEKISGCNVIEIPTEYFVSETPGALGANPANLSEAAFSYIANKIAQLCSLDCEVMQPMESRMEALFQTFSPLLQSGDVPSISELHKSGNCFLAKGQKTKAAQCEKLITILRNSSVPLSVKLASSVSFGYGGIAVVIHANCEIGDFVKIGTNVTLGGGRETIGADGKKRGVPLVEKRVYVATGAKLIGGITIGHHSVIGANAVVTADVPPFSVVAGNPGRIINEITPENFRRYLTYLYKNLPADDAARLMFANGK